MADGQNAQASSALTLTLVGQNDAPVIESGGGGSAAIYWVRVQNTAITQVRATDVDTGDIIKYSIIGGADAPRFIIDDNVGTLAFSSLPQPPNRSYQVQVQASDGHPGGSDTQAITVNVAADKMAADAFNGITDTFVFHAKFGANTVSGFNLLQDVLQFDKGMFTSDTVAAVLAAAQDDGHGNVVISAQAARLTVQDISVAGLTAHPADIRFA
jgi:hypothetical protein